MEKVERSGRSRSDAARNRMVLVRAGYWIFAAFELLSFVPMLSPALFAKVMGIQDFHPGPEYTYAMGIAATFTLGWVALVMWAERKPAERRDVMLLTVVPVLVGNLLCGGYAATSGFVPAAMMIPGSIVQVVLIILFAFGYREARTLAR
jgi:hypothetical protein